MCEVPGCFVRPSFKFPVRGAASQRCARHKLPGMVGNSGKVSFPVSPVTTPGDEFKACTPKRARGELLKIQREQMMQILGENAVTSSPSVSDANADLSSPHSAPATSCKRMHLLGVPDAADAELTTPSSSTRKEHRALTAQVAINKSLTAAFPITPTTAASSFETAKEKLEGILGGSSQPSSLLQSAAECGILNFRALYAAQQSTVPQFTTQEAGSCDAAAAPASLQSEIFPVNTNAPCGSINISADFNQALQALSAFNASLWAPMVAMNTLSSPLMPNFNPWAAAAMPMPPNQDMMAYDPSLTLIPSVLSTQNSLSHLPQILATLSADVSSQTANLFASSLPSERNNNAP